MLIQAAAAAVVADVETYRIGRYTHWKHTHTAYINIRIYTRAGTLYPSCVYYTYKWYARLFFYMLSRSLALYTEIVYYKWAVCACSIHTFFFISFRFASFFLFCRSLSLSLPLSLSHSNCIYSSFIAVCCYSFSSFRSHSFRPPFFVSFCHHFYTHSTVWVLRFAYYYDFSSGHTV